MACVHHVKVNWFEAETEPLAISPYYEWRKSDFLDTYQTLPVICLEPVVFDMIETSLSPLPKSFLQRMFQASFKHHHRYDFSTIICDQSRVLAIDTLGYEFPLLKSRLTPIKEKQTLNLCESLDVCSFKIKYQPQDVTEYDLTHQQLLGLTRKERELKRLLLFMFKQLSDTKQLAALEYFTTLYYRLTNQAPQSHGHLFLQELKSEFTEVHIELIKNMLPLNHIYQELYEDALNEETYEYY